MKSREKIKNIIEWSFCILFAITMAFVIRYYVGTPTLVKSISMNPTLIENQRLVINRISRTIKENPKRGEIITFEAPDRIQDDEKVNNQHPEAIYSKESKNVLDYFIYHIIEYKKVSYIKRVIALPGEHVEIKNGQVYINGNILKESYLLETMKTSSANLNNFYVPQNTVFVMGDNRTESYDSRELGCIPLDRYEGKLWIRFWPFSLFGKVE